MVRLPVPGSDEGSWGKILNEYLSQAHKSDGTLKNGAVTVANLAQEVQDKLDVIAGQQGPTGPVGPQGSAGAIGASGTPGAVGATGASGAQGIQGFTGPSGAAGPTGVQGATGPQGPAGATGPAGEASYTVTTQSATSYTLAAADAGKLISCSNDASTTITVPTNASAPFPVGAKIRLLQFGAGQVNMQGANGVTLYAAPGTATAMRYGVVELVKIGTNIWSLSGDLAAASGDPEGPGEEEDADKPTDETVGPRTGFTTMTGGALTGSHSGVEFTTFVNTAGPLILTDCKLSGGMNVSNGPVVLDHCQVDGWFQVSTTNTNQDLQVFKATHTKFIGADDNDVMHLGNESWWGPDASNHLNAVFEDCIIYSPYDDIDTVSHFDIVQFSGGGGYATFTRVVFQYKDQAFGGGATNAINNGTANNDVTLNNCWIEGGPFGYVLAGPMTVTDTVIDRSSSHWGYTYDNRSVLVNCTNDLGEPIAS